LRRREACRSGRSTHGRRAGRTPALRGQDTLEVSGSVTTSTTGLLLPLLSEYDPRTTSEGTLDPLGLYTIADALGRLLVPGVRERQSRVRLLTAYAASLLLSREFEPEEMAVDGVSEPWIVFEWHLIEGLVRSLPADELVGLPGRDKASAAVRAGAHLSATRYLKAPAAFGFHGVYRALARDVGVEVSEQLGEVGVELLAAWAEDQGLAGFVGTTDGDGRRLRGLLVDAMRAGLQAGEVARGAGWQGWALLGRHLAPQRVGDRERQVLRRALDAPDAGQRSAVLCYLISDEGQGRWLESLSEREFHAALRATCDAHVAGLLDAISAYETFSRLLNDAFNACLHEMTLSSSRVRPAQLGAASAVIAAAERVPALADGLFEHLSAYGQAAALTERFADVLQPSDPATWSLALLSHHKRVQEAKPPAGKAPWCERLDDGSYMVRPAYRVEVALEETDAYVHAYRTQPLWNFARDLGLVV